MCFKSVCTVRRAYVRARTKKRHVTVCTYVLQRRGSNVQALIKRKEQSQHELYKFNSMKALSFICHTAGRTHRVYNNSHKVLFAFAHLPPASPPPSPQHCMCVCVCVVHKISIVTVRYDKKLVVPLRIRMPTT